MSDHYQTLGVSKNASKDEIKKAFYKLAQQHHPDKSGGNEKKFKEINEAYQVLSDDKKRQQYDAYGSTFDDSGAGGGYGGQGFGGFDFSGFQQGGGFGNGGVEFDLNDIFENFFSGGGGGGRGATRTKRGRDISVDLEISFEESVFGVERRVLLNKQSFCSECGGSGAEKGSTMETCKYCQGAGKINETKRSIFGSFTSLKECDKCNGAGKISAKKCPVCRGRGVATKSEEIQVRVPSGIQDGEMIKLSGMGEAVAGGIAGDLYAKIHVRQHQIFRREGNNLVMTLDIKITEAVLGTEKEIKTLDGNIVLKISAGIDSGEILRVRGKGVPYGRGNRGDIMIKIIIRTPKKFSKQAKKLFEELKNEEV